MNAIEQARQGYAPSHFPLKSARAVEAQLISQITARLRQAAHRAECDFPNLVAAIHDNRRMWNALAVDVADSDNTLPAHIRAQIFYLAEFTELHSQNVLRNNASTDALIEINSAILRGLHASEAA